MILNTLFSLDKSLFFLINNLPHGVFFDFVGVFLSAGSGFIWFFIISLILLLRDREAGRLSTIALILSGLLTNLFVGVLKPLIARPRPDLVDGIAISVHSRVDSIVPFLSRVYDYSFPSGHATIAFAGAFILSHFFSKGKKWWFFLAVLVSLSRVYLGKHYPSDVIAGMILGLGVGLFTLRIVKLFISPAVI